MKKELYGIFAADGDMTFVMEDTYNDEGKLFLPNAWGGITESRTKEITKYLKVS